MKMNTPIVHPKPPLPSICKYIETNSNLRRSNWHRILKKEEHLKVLRNFFKRNFKKPPTDPVRAISEYFISTQFFPKIENTIVHEEIDKLSKQLQVSRKIYELRHLGPMRKMETFGDCTTTNSEISQHVRQIFSIFHLETHIGNRNCEKLCTWILGTLFCEKNLHVPQFEFKDVPFARAFRAKAVLSEEDFKAKRGIQLSIFANVMHGLFWWILAAIRETIIPIQCDFVEVLYWRRGYLKFLKLELADFRKRYGVRKIRRASKLRPLPNTALIGRLKFRVIRRKLRPVFPKNSGKKCTRLYELYLWKRLNSLIAWALEQNSIGRKHIPESCKTLYRFLAANPSQEMHGFTADIKKCFSSVDHNILMDTLTSIMKETVYYTIQGSGFGDKNRWRMYCCTGKTENEAKSKLEEKLRTLKRTERKCVQPIKRDILLEELQTIISSYHFKRGKTTLKVTRGVPQGHPVSSNFSHVYLSKFEDFYWRNELKNEENSMVYCRYEDDYVFFAKEKATVEKMLSPLFTAKNRFGLAANSEKSQYSTKKLKWCSILMDLRKRQFWCRKRFANGKCRKLKMKLD